MGRFIKRHIGETFEIMPSGEMISLLEDIIFEHHRKLKEQIQYHEDFKQIAIFQVKHLKERLSAIDTLPVTMYCYQCGKLGTPMDKGSVYDNECGNCKSTSTTRFIKSSLIKEYTKWNEEKR